MRTRCVVFILLLLLGGGPLLAKDTPVGVEAVEALLAACADARAIVTVLDPKTGKVANDPQLGIPKFVVPDGIKLRATLKSHAALMQHQKSREALIGCTKRAGSEFASGWVDLLLAVGREQQDRACIRVSYNVAAVHGLPLGSERGFADLKILINRALETQILEYHAARPRGIAWLTIHDAAKFNALLESRRELLHPGLIGAAANMSRNVCDHAEILKAIAAFVALPEATAYGAEFTARDYASQLKPLLRAAELELAVRTFGELDDLPSQARNLTQLGRVRRELGEDEQALEHFDRALQALSVVHEGPHRQVAELHRLKAELFCDRHETQRSLNAYMKAVTLYSALPPADEDFLDVAAMMRLLARVDLLMGHPDDAHEKLTDILDLLDEVDRLVEPRFDTLPPRTLTLRDLGSLELRQGRSEEARLRLDAALDLQLRREGAVHPETIKTLLAMGQVCAARDEPGQSEFFTRQALIFLQHHYGMRHPEVVAAHSDRADILVARGNDPEAALELDRGLNAARIHGAPAATAADYLPTLATVQLLSSRGELSLRAADLAKKPEEQQKLLRDAQGDFVLAEGVFNRIRRSMPGDEDRLSAGDKAPEFLHGQLACGARLQRLGVEAENPQAAFALVERATARSLAEVLGEEIGRLRGMPDELRGQHRQLRMKLDTTLREATEIPFEAEQREQSPVQKAAWNRHRQAEQALQEFEQLLKDKYPVPAPETGFDVCTPQAALAALDPTEAAVTFLIGQRESFAVVLSHGGEGPAVSVHRLPAREMIENQIATLIDPSVMDQPLGRELGEELYDQLLKPLDQEIAGKNLVIVPTGPLCRLPFELLRGPDPAGRQYLGLSRQIRYAPSLTVLRLLNERDRSSRSHPDRNLWAMANPQVEPLPALPRAEVEVRAIAASLRAAPEDVRIGAAATRVALLEASAQKTLRRHRFLHFAVHAGISSESIPLPGLQLGGSGGQSGFIPMNEIAHLDLNAELVVLSACSSGGGRIFGGEGIRGLTGAFLLAGGRGVIATHWSLEDAGAARFMEAFYRRLQAGTKPAKALWLTRREATAGDESRPPSEWAAFILVGN